MSVSRLVLSASGRLGRVQNPTQLTNQQKGERLATGFVDMRASRKMAPFHLTTIDEIEGWNTPLLEMADCLRHVFAICL